MHLLFFGIFLNFKAVGTIDFIFKNIINYYEKLLFFHFLRDIIFFIFFLFFYYSEITFKSVLRITVKLWYDQIIVLGFCISFFTFSFLFPFNLRYLLCHFFLPLLLIIINFLKIFCQIVRRAFLCLFNNRQPSIYGM